jgi:hypothetical protein
MLGRLMRIDQILNICIFAKFTQFSNKAIFAYMITIGSFDWFSQLGFLFLEINIEFNKYWITWYTYSIFLEIHIYFIN